MSPARLPPEEPDAPFVAQCEKAAAAELMPAPSIDLRQEAEWLARLDRAVDR